MPTEKVRNRVKVTPGPLLVLLSIRAKNTIIRSYGLRAFSSFSLTTESQLPKWLRKTVTSASEQQPDVNRPKRQGPVYRRGRRRGRSERPDGEEALGVVSGGSGTSRLSTTETLGPINAPGKFVIVSCKPKQSPPDSHNLSVVYSITT